MRSPTFLLTFALGLLPSVHVAAADLPVFSTLENSFVLRTLEDFNVIFRYQEHIKSYTPVISRSKIRLPEYRLQDGNLTTSDQSLQAFYPPVPLIYPPVLIPIRFGKQVVTTQEAGCVAVTRYVSGRKTLRLWALDGSKLTY